MDKIAFNNPYLFRVRIFRRAEIFVRKSVQSDGWLGYGGQKNGAPRKGS
jgi:hypothetical protein